jgi:hypothetical protein
LYESNTQQLFDLSKDPSERNDLSQSMPNEKEAMRQQLEKYLLTVDAQFPQVNPNYNPNAVPAREETRGKRGQNNKGKKAGN